MPKSFLFTRHKRYEYDSHEETKTTTSTKNISAFEIPPPSKYPLVMPIKVPCIKPEPCVLRRAEVMNHSQSDCKTVRKQDLQIMPSWVSPVTLPRKIEVEMDEGYVDVGIEEDMMIERDEKYYGDCNGTNGRYTRLKIPALVPVRRDWKSVLTDCAFRVYENGNAATDRSVPICLQHEDDQPVNLSVKKVDLFNLNRLAEVSLATAEGRSFSTTSTNPSPITSTSSSPNPAASKNAEDYEMGDLRICESPIPNEIKLQPLSPEIQSQSDDNTSHTTGVVEEGPSKAINDNTNSNTACSGRHKCLECGKGFSTLSNLARHRQTHRSLSDSSAVKKCPHCDKVYVSMPAFSMHLRTHNQGCKCPYCGKGFSRPWLLQGHIRTHTGEKPFKCPICAKAFADKSNLRAHTQTHSSEKPFICNRCGKPFALKSYLCKHIESSCMKTSRSSSEKTSSSKSSSSIVDPLGTGGDSSCSSFSATTEEGSNGNDSS